MDGVREGGEKGQLRGHPTEHLKLWIILHRSCEDDGEAPICPVELRGDVGQRV